MNIETVKKQGDGFLVNGSMYVPAITSNRHYKIIKKWMDDGNVPIQEFTKKELQQKKIQSIEAAIQKRLDDRARLSGYDDINAIGKYLGYENPFKAECEMLGAWMASTWQSAGLALSDWQAGGTEPTEEEVIAGLPAIP